MTSCDQIVTFGVGMGEDGDGASIFPDWVPPTRRAHVDLIGDSPKPPAEGITMTLALLKTASETILVADGDSKHAVRTRLAQGEPSLPAAQPPLASPSSQTSIRETRYD